MNNNGNLPAYPVSCVDDDGHMTGTQYQISGMTKREQFAMAAMQGILATMLMRPEDAAEKAVKYANALLAELERAK